MDETQVREMQRVLLKLNAGFSQMVGETPVVTFKDFATSYLQTKMLRAKLRPATKRSFENQVRRHLVPQFGDIPIGKLSNAEWLQWIGKEKGITKFFNARKSLIEIMTAACEAGIITKVPSFENPDEYEPVGRVLLLSEIHSILRKAVGRFRVIFYAFWKMGCRPREILQWEWSMIEWVRPGRTFAYIRIPARISKTGRAREIPLDPSLTTYLRTRFERGNGSIYVFPKPHGPDKPQWSYQSAWVTACRKAKVADAMVYDFRRTWITRCLAAGKSTDFVAKQLDTSAAMIRRFYLKDDADTMEGLFS